MPKILLLDADGVVIQKREYFSEYFAREHGVPVDSMREFFKNEFKGCQVGKADLKEVLKDKLPAWGWDKSVEEFLEYWFTTDVHPDEEVLALVQTFRANGVKCYLATDQEKYRKERVLKALEGKLDGDFISCDLGFTKSQPEFFQKILTQFNCQPSDVLYFDDDQHNVDTARSLGIDARFYTNLADLNIKSQ